jgi:hypothetical protein
MVTAPGNDADVSLGILAAERMVLGKVLLKSGWSLFWKHAINFPHDPLAHWTAAATRDSVLGLGLEAKRSSAVAR